MMLHPVKTLLHRFTAVLPVVVALLGFGASALATSDDFGHQPAYVLVACEDGDEDCSDDEECEEDDDCEDDEDSTPTYVPTPTPTTASPTPTPTPTPSPTPTATSAAPAVGGDTTRPTSSQTNVGGLDPSAVIVFGFLALVAVAAVVDAIRRRNAPAIVDHRAVPESATFEPSSGHDDD